MDQNFSIKTSYYGKYKEANGVSISQTTLVWFKGDYYRLLNPGDSILWPYKDGKISWDEYKTLYKKKLSLLDPHKVAIDLNGKVLLCHERERDECHRGLVANWLEESLGILVPELSDKLDTQMKFSFTPLQRKRMKK
jgi:hypothetical protein